MVNSEKFLDFRKRNFLVIFLGCLLLFPIVPGCSSKEDKVANFIEKGDSLLAKGDPTRAVVEYMNALQLDIRNTRAMLSMARANIALKQYPKAYNDLRSVLGIDPNLDEAKVELASLLVMATRGEMALEELDKINDVEKHRPRVNLVRAQALILLNRYSDAVDTLLQIERNDSNKEALALLSLCFKETGKLEAMESTILKWRNLDPKNPTSYLFAAQNAVEAKNFDRAEAELQAMVEANPDDIDLALFRVQTLERLGLFEKAEAAFGKLPPEPLVLKTKAEFLTARGKVAQAQSVLKELLAKTPDDVDAVVRLAQLQADSGQMEAALESVEKALTGNFKRSDKERLVLAKAALFGSRRDWGMTKSLCESVLAENQGNMDAHLILGKALMNLGKFEEAEVHLNQVATTRQDDAEVQVLLARCRLLARKETLAGDTLRKALTANPGNVAIVLELARYHLAGNDTDQAFRVLEEGLMLQPSEPSLLMAMGEVESIRKNYSRADSLYKDVIKLDPASPRGYMAMGRLMLAQSRLDDAIEWFKQALSQEEGWQATLPVLLSTCIANGSFETALEIMGAEVKKRPGSPLVYYYLGQTLLEKGDLTRGEEAFLKALELAPLWLDPSRALAEVYVKQGRLEEARAKLEQAYNRESSIPTGMQLAILYEHLDHHEKAIHLYNDLISKHEKIPPEILNNLAYLYAEYGSGDDELKKSAELAAKALSQTPENPGVLDTMAWSAYKRGELDIAWNYLQEALKRAPDTAVLNLHAAIVARDRGQNELSLNLLKKAIHQNLDHATHRKALALEGEWTNRGM